MTNIRKLLSSNLRILFVLLVIGSLMVSVVSPIQKKTFAAGDSCTPPSTVYGTDTTTVSVPGNGTYDLWARMEISSASNNSFLLNLDGSTCYNVGDSTSIPLNTWTWVNYYDGSTGNVMTASLASGSHTLTLTGTKENVNIDRVEVLDNSCTPTGTGDNCESVSTPTCTAGSSTAVTAPTNLSSTAGATTMALTWSGSTASPGCSITGYNVYRNGTKIASGLGTTSYTDTNLNPNTSYTYYVVATDSGPNTSAASSSISPSTASLNIPSGLSATAASSSQINLSWPVVTNGSDTVSSYNVYRSTSSTTGFNSIGSVLTSNCTGSGNTVCSYNDTTASASTKYYYEVTDVDSSSNESAPSNVANATTPAPTCTGEPSAATNFTQGSVTYSSLAFSWTAPSAANGCTIGYHVYEIYPGTSSASTLISSPSTTTVSISSLIPNTIYTYVVVPYYTNSGSTPTVPTATSNASIVVTTSVDPAPTAPPTATASSVNNNEITLNWGAGTDHVQVTGYNIYRCTDSSSTSANCTIGNTPLATVGGGALSYQDNSVGPSTSYTYAVSAINANPSESSKTTATPNPITTAAATGTAPSAPTNLVAAVVSAHSATITLTAGAGATSYNAYINGVYISNSTGTSVTLPCLEPGTNYTITLKSSNSYGLSSAATVNVSTLSGTLGDIACTGTVNSTDLFTLLRNWQLTPALPSQGDINADIIVNSTDLFDLLRNWGATS